jgi:hypothetical protein
VPASCEACQPVEIHPANADAWETLQRFPGILAPDPGGRVAVNYPAADIVAARLYLDPVFFIEQLEATARGLNNEPIQD